MTQRDYTLTDLEKIRAAWNKRAKEDLIPSMLFDIADLKPELEIYSGWAQFKIRNLDIKIRAIGGLVSTWGYFINVTGTTDNTVYMHWFEELNPGESLKMAEDTRQKYQEVQKQNRIIRGEWWDWVLEAFQDHIKKIEAAAMQKTLQRKKELIEQLQIKAVEILNDDYIKEVLGGDV